jgi:hypothetical protein
LMTVLPANAEKSIAGAIQAALSVPGTLPSADQVEKAAMEVV